jgi:rod shape determining protein RodA
MNLPPTNNKPAAPKRKTVISAILPDERKEQKNQCPRMSTRNNSISQGVDWLIIWLYAVLVAVGVLCIFMVEYKPDNWVWLPFSGGKTNYSKQLIFAAFCTVIATFIAYRQQTVHRLCQPDVCIRHTIDACHFCTGKKSMAPKAGSRSVADLTCSLPRLCKIFTLALAKFLSRQETEFSVNQITAYCRLTHCGAGNIVYRAA